MTPTTDLIARLREAEQGDHSRGCEGRQYTCSCGYDGRIRKAAYEAADALTAQEAELARLREALKPFARLDMPADTKWTCGTFLIEHDDIRAARALSGGET